MTTRGQLFTVKYHNLVGNATELDQAMENYAKNVYHCVVLLRFWSMLIRNYIFRDRNLCKQNFMIHFATAPETDEKHSGLGFYDEQILFLSKSKFYFYQDEKYSNVEKMAT